VCDRTECRTGSNPNTSDSETRGRQNGRRRSEWLVQNWTGTVEMVCGVVAVGWVNSKRDWGAFGI